MAPQVSTVSAATVAPVATAAMAAMAATAQMVLPALSLLPGPVAQMVETVVTPETVATAVGPVLVQAPQRTASMATEATPA
jgi:hypothetical protein